MSNELHHECGVLALYWLGKSAGSGGATSKAISQNDGDVVSLIPPMLLDLQNRGQLAAGMSSYKPGRAQLLDTYKDIGTVAEAFRMSHPDKYNSILSEYAGPAAIGHTRYATCGQDDSRYAQPFERHHGRMWKWFSFAFNGNLANYNELGRKLLSRGSYHLSLNTDTEIIMHMLSYCLRGDKPAGLKNVMSSLARQFDGSYNLVFLDAMGRMFVARDPLGLRPLCWGTQGKLFAAASESVALTNMGFKDVKSIEPGEMAIIEKGELRFERFAGPRRPAHCFFEWVYFSNVASVHDGASVYMARARSGEKLAEMEDQKMDDNCIVVPVPDTAKAAADSFAYNMGIPCVEGLIRNRYVGRTFIQPDSSRGRSAKSKYTALPGVCAGKKVFMIEDSIVRSTTLKSLVHKMRSHGKAKEIHVRVACPPIVAPCFYGIDMSTLDELFAPKFIDENYDGTPDEDMLARMARRLDVDSLKYIPVKDLAGCIGIPGGRLCRGCVTGRYPSRWGNKLIKCARENLAKGKSGRTYE